MATDGTVLKALLRERHLQEHQAFCREYDRVARRVDPGLQHSYPSKATFYRWLSGGLRKLPYPGHCRVLEAMLPGWSVEELFRARLCGEALSLVRGQEPASNGVTAASSTTARFLTLLRYLRAGLSSPTGSRQTSSSMERMTSAQWACPLIFSASTMGTGA